MPKCNARQVERSPPRPKKICLRGIIADWSKAFDCLNNQLSIVKLVAYGFGNEALAFICHYLSNRKQRTTEI